MKHLWAWLMVSLGTVAALVVGCGGDDAAAPGADGLTPVTLALNWKPEPQFGGFYAAAVSGAYAQNRLKVEIMPGGSGTPTVQMVGTGQVPFGIVSADELIIARTKGIDVVALFAVYQVNPQGLMAHESRGFEKIDDIFAQPGKLAIQSGLAYAKFLENKYGFGRLEVLPNKVGVDGWLSDPQMTLQCFITSEPLTAERLGAKPRTFLVADAGYNPYTTVMITRGDYARSNPEVVDAMIAAVRAGWEAYLADPSAANAMMQQLNPSMSPETFVRSAMAQVPLIQSNHEPSAPLGTMTLERWDELGRQLVELGVVETAPPASECVYRGK